MPAEPERPILRYHGGKWMLAPWIISHFPVHRIYVEPYGGAASVLLQKPRCFAEVYNDLDSEIVNLFRVIRLCPDIVSLIELTPFSREEYAQSFEPTIDFIEQARRTLIRSHMGFGSNSLCRSVKSGFRSSSNRSGSSHSQDWRNFPSSIPSIIDRLRGVVLENKPAVEVMERHDGPKTLHYCDPPYPHGTRTQWAGHGARSGYRHEMTDKQHRAFLRFAKKLKGQVIISGYANPIYDKVLGEWHRVESKVLADGAWDRIEILWMNYQPPQSELF